MVHSMGGPEPIALQAAPATNASHGAAATAPQQQQQPQQFVFALDEPMWRDLCRVAEAMGGPLLPQRQLAQDGAIEAQAEPTAAPPQQPSRLANPGNGTLTRHLHRRSAHATYLIHNDCPRPASDTPQAG